MSLWAAPLGTQRPTRGSPETATQETCQTLKGLDWARLCRMCARNHDEDDDNDDLNAKWTLKAAKADLGAFVH